MDTLIDASYLHQLDQDYTPVTSPFTWEPFTTSSTWTPKSYKEQSKLKTGDIVTIRPDLTPTSSTRKEQYKVISYNTINGYYGIVPVRSPFELPVYYTREELILVPPANKKESFLYKVGDVVVFKLPMSLKLPPDNKTTTGLIIDRYSINETKMGPTIDTYSIKEKYYKIKIIKDTRQYTIKESDIIEKLCTSVSESEQQKAVNMENSIGQPKIGIGDIVSISFPEVPFDSSTFNQYKVTDIDITTGKYKIVPVYPPSGIPKYHDRKDLLLRRKAGEETPFLFKKGDLVSFKLLWCNDIRYGQIEKTISAATNCYMIKCLTDSCHYLMEESDIEKITYTAPDCNSAETSITTWTTTAKAESLSVVKGADSVNEEKPLNIKIVKKQIKLNFKN